MFVFLTEITILKTNDIIDLDSDRTTDPNKYIPLFKEIISSGYDIIYMGSLSQKINFKHNSFLNIAIANTTMILMI